MIVQLVKTYTPWFTGILGLLKSEINYYLAMDEKQILLITLVQEMYQAQTTLYTSKHDLSNRHQPRCTTESAMTERDNVSPGTSTRVWQSRRLK